MKKVVGFEARMLKDVPNGEYFTFSPIEEYPSESKVYVKDGYDRSMKRYCYHKFVDVCADRTAKGSKIVYVGFTF